MLRDFLAGCLVSGAVIIALAMAYSHAEAAPAPTPYASELAGGVYLEVAR